MNCDYAHENVSMKGLTTSGMTSACENVTRKWIVSEHTFFLRRPMQAFSPFQCLTLTM